MNIIMSGCAASVGEYMRKQMEAQGHRVYGVGLDGPEFQCDISETLDLGLGEGLVERMYRGAAGYFDNFPVDTIVCHAGITNMDYVENHSVDKFVEILQVNLVLPFVMIKGFVNQIKQECSDARDGDWQKVPRRKIICTGSIGTRLSLRTSTAYVASKWAIEGMAKVVAKEAANRYPLTVITIAPGAIDGTTMTNQEHAALMRTRNMTADEATAYSSHTGRKASFEEIWSVYDFALNHAPEYMNGGVITVPNGLGV